jgi:hypothetical protein
MRSQALASAIASVGRKCELFAISPPYRVEHFYGSNVA